MNVLLLLGLAQVGKPLGVTRVPLLFGVREGVMFSGSGRWCAPA